MSIGKIFSIEEFSTFDGPGIRMTVFLKGCPLRCIWCHNPEGQSFENEILRSPNGCIECGACLKAGIIEKGFPCLVEQSVSLCPRSLVRICGEDISAEELIVMISKKIDMLNSCGGGVTFSGGEPLSQPDFLFECLSGLNGKTHRAIQTTGFCQEQVFQKILSESDYVLYDLKIIDAALHKKYTGVDNLLILKNYTALAKSEKQFITRIPLIPSINDTEENICATAMLMNRLGINRVELLPYNKAAGAKYKLLGRAYKPDLDGSLPPNQHIDIFERYNIEAKVL